MLSPYSLNLECILCLFQCKTAKGCQCLQWSPSPNWMNYVYPRTTLEWKGSVQVLTQMLKWIWCRNGRAFVWVEADILLGRRLFQSVTIAFCWSGFETRLDKWGTQCERGTVPLTSAFFVPLIHVGTFLKMSLFHFKMSVYSWVVMLKECFLGNKQCVLHLWQDTLIWNRKPMPFS